LSIIKYLLYPFGFIYGIVLKIRRLFYEKKWLQSYKFPVPVIVVGNLSMGGTGKTPHVEFLIRHFSSKLHLATLSRGYGRKSKGYLLASQLPEEDKTAQMLGDEPLQFMTKFPSLEVAVCENRVLGIEKLLLDRPETEMILLDDAFQHLSVKANCNVLLMDFNSPYYNDFPIPAGRLREFPTTAKYANVIVVTKCSPNLSDKEKKEIEERINPTKNQEIYFSTYLYEQPVPITEKAQCITLSSDTPIVLISGIAHPESLQKFVQKTYKNVICYHFPDHYVFKEQDLNKILWENEKTMEQGGIILSTEKDVMRLVTGVTKKIISLHPLFALPIRVEILFDEKEKLIKKINSYVRKD